MTKFNSYSKNKIIFKSFAKNLFYNLSIILKHTQINIIKFLSKTIKIELKKNKPLILKT